MENWDNTCCFSFYFHGNVINWRYYLFFSTQIINVAQEFTHFKYKIIRAFTYVTLFINNHVSIGQSLEKGELFSRIKDWKTDSTGFLVSKAVSNTASFLAGSMATIIFTFLFLIYRDPLIMGVNMRRNGIVFQPQKTAFFSAFWGVSLLRNMQFFNC